MFSNNVISMSIMNVRTYRKVGKGNFLLDCNAVQTARNLQPLRKDDNYLFHPEVKSRSFLRNIGYLYTRLDGFTSA